MAAKQQLDLNLINSRIQLRHGAAQAALLRRLGNLDVAEDAMQDAIVKALETWPRDGIPDNIVAWLVTTGLNSFRDRYRKDRRHEELLATLDAQSLDVDSELSEELPEVDDDVLRLIFLCCHPAIAPENQLALTLKTVMGFSLREISRAFLLQEKTLEQRLTRSKRKIVGSGILFEIPQAERLQKRLIPVQQVLYLIFNEGYYGSSGELIDHALCRHAITLCRSLCRVIPEPENLGLLALMLFQDARAPARIDKEGNLVTLDKQDRSLWRQAQIAEADVLLQKALRNKQSGIYQLQAAIAGLHSQAKSQQETDWLQIVGLYRLLMQHQGGPVISLNYAVALLFAGKTEQAAPTIMELEPELKNYGPYWAARAKLAELNGEQQEQITALQQAISLSGSEQEIKHYQLQLQQQENGGDAIPDTVH